MGAAPYNIILDFFDSLISQPERAGWTISMRYFPVFRRQESVAGTDDDFYLEFPFAVFKDAINIRFISSDKDNSEV